MRVDVTLRDIPSAIRELLLALSNRLTAAENFAPEGNINDVLTSNGPNIAPSYKPITALIEGAAADALALKENISDLPYDVESIVATLFVDSGTIDFVYDPSVPSITAVVKPGSLNSTYISDFATAVELILANSVSRYRLRGEQGDEGDQGPTGPPGKDGAAGAAGVSNTPGPPGPPGDDGDAGPPGPPGNTGPAGAASIVPGPQGPVIVGADGADGEDGRPGSTGPSGADSTVPGPQGVPGRGSDGEDGSDGAPGPQGNPGADGARGADGAPGQPGRDGEDGQDGAPGLPGSTGTTGTQGPQGGPSTPGADGETGQDGERGPPGPVGADSVVPGPQGVPGRGIDGEDGSDGMPGVPGPAGTTGSAGSAGATGAQGPIGQGLDGADGDQGPPSSGWGTLVAEMVQGGSFLDPLYTFARTLSIGSNTASAGPYVVALNAISGVDRDIQWKTAGVLRWILRVDTTAEGGGNAGSNILLLARNDAGGTIDAPLSIVRAAGGLLLITRPVSFNFGGGPQEASLDATGLFTASAGLITQGPVQADRVIHGTSGVPFPFRDPTDALDTFRIFDTGDIGVVRDIILNSTITHGPLPSQSGEDGDEGRPIPGNTGPQGDTGPQTVLVVKGEDGEDAYSAPQGVPQHGADQHYDFLDSFFLPAQLAVADGGALVLIGAHPNAVSAISLADAATQGANWTFAMPRNWAGYGPISIFLLWIPGATDAVAHTVRWQFTAKVMTIGSDVTAAGTATLFTGTSAARTVNILVQEAGTALGVTPNVGAASQLQLNVRRIGADAADTYVGVVNLMGFKLIYTAHR